MPSIQRILLFRIDACPESSLIEGSKWLERGVDAACVHDESVSQFRKKLAKRFKLKLAGAWISAIVDDSLRPFLDHVMELTRQGMARFGSGFLTERLSYSDQFEWYRLEPQLEFNDRNRKVAAVQLLSQPWQTYASSRFREIVERENFRGLIFGPPSFEPIRGDSRSWFACLAGALAGRGLDHDWAPPNESDVEEGSGRLGADSARNDTAAVDRLDPVVAELCAQFPPGALNLKSFARIWAGSLAESDFAGLASITGANEWRADSIIIIRRLAASVLLKAGVLTTEMLGPIDVVASRVAARVPILDEEIGPLPRSLIAMVAARRASQNIDEPPGESNEPLEIPRSRAASLSIAEADRVDPNDIRSAAALLGIEVPDVWHRFLTEIGRTYLGDMIPSHPSSWVEDQPVHEDLKALDDSLPSRMLAVGSSLNGDWYSLDLDQVSGDGDCPLLKFDHEISKCVDCWPSVGEFINEMLDDRATE